jgi:hypothetical protein
MGDHLEKVPSMLPLRDEDPVTPRCGVGKPEARTRSYGLNLMYHLLRAVVPETGSTLHATFWPALTAGL